MQAVELGHERFLLITIGQFKYALRLGEVDRVVRQPFLVDWLGGGAIQAYSLIEGCLVWVVGTGQLFSGFERGTNRTSDWLIVLRDVEGIARVGIVADDVRGPVSQPRLGQATVLSRLGFVDENR